MVKLKTNSELRGFRFTLFYTYRSNEGYIGVELAVSDGKHPSKKEVVKLAEAYFIRSRVKAFGKIGETEFESDQFDVCITNIQEFNDTDYFNWIEIGKKLEEEE